MFLIITLRREVTDSDQGTFLYEVVKQKLSDHPEITISAHITNHIEDEPVPE